MGRFCLGESARQRPRPSHWRRCRPTAGGCLLRVKPLFGKSGATDYVNLSAEPPYDLGYGLLKEFWGRGIVTEAARAVVEQARQEGLPYLPATHDRENPGSGGVMRKLGMVYQYSYEEQWQPKDIRVVFRLYQMDLDGQERSYRGYWDRNPVHFVEPGLGRE